MLHEQWEQAADHFLHAIRVAFEINAQPELARACADFVQLAYFNGDLYDGRTLSLLEKAKSLFSELEMLPHAQVTSKIQESIFGPPESMQEVETESTDLKHLSERPTRNGTKSVE